MTISLRKKSKSAIIDHLNPSEVTDAYWLCAERKSGKYPKHTERCGKWLVFVPMDAIDEVWKKIKVATENGVLGGSSKVATARPNPNATSPNTKVICVYTYDWSDKKDVIRIREELRTLGINAKIPYKADDSTLAGKYSNRGDKGISTYYG